MDAYLRALSIEGFTCYSLNPGAIDTAMQEKIRASAFPGAEAFSALKLKSPKAIADALFFKIDRRLGI